MYKSYNEIFSQYDALEKTMNYIENKKEEIDGFLKGRCFNSVTFTGAGSSYCLCKSAKTSLKLMTNMKTGCFAAGDLMINFNRYEKVLKNTLLVAPSRSGRTSELISVFQKSAGLADSSVLICAAEGSTLSEMAGFSLEIPWAFDESVCQTRTVTNLYLADLMLVNEIALAREEASSGSGSLTEELKQVINSGEDYIEQYRDVLKNAVDSMAFDKVVVLADADLSGIGEEASLAFKEICRVQAGFHNVLDVRHGPMVLIDGNALVIAAVTRKNSKYQADLIGDLKSNGAHVITVSDIEDNIWGSDINVFAGSFNNPAVFGIPFIFVSQALSYFKAVSLGVNPDKPEGLEPCIQLKQQDKKQKKG